MKKHSSLDFYYNKNPRLKSLLRIIYVSAIIACCGATPLAAATADLPMPGAAAQQNTISGVVTDESGEPLISVTVKVKGADAVGTVTDMDGNFTVQAAVGDVLQFSYVGFTTQEIIIKNYNPLIVVLGEDSELLDEVVVVGYGVQKKATLTGSVAVIDGKDMLQTKTANIANSLTGRVSGLVISNRSGNPGEETTDITIRGLGTTGKTNPLIVIDGVANRGGFERLTPDDIESISVLKDASAAIYGAQAANGVILITTKRGTEGKLRMSYSNSFSASQATRRPKLMNAEQYLTWKDEQNSRYGRPTEYQDVIEQYRNGTNDPQQWADTDWWDTVIDKWSLQQQHTLTLSGGTKNVNYYISGQYLDQDAIYKGSDYGYKQYNVRSNIDAQVTKNFSLGVDLAYRIGDVKAPTLTTEDLIREVYVAAPYDLPYYQNGLLSRTSNGNPVPKTNGQSGEKNTQTKRAESKLSFRWDLPFITEGLYVSGYGAYDYYTAYRKDLNQPYDLYSYNAETDEYVNHRDQTGTISLFQQQGQETNKTLNVMLGYERQFGNHRISGFAAYEQYQHYYEYFSASRKDLISGQLPYLFTGSDDGKDNTGAGEETARRNIFGRVNYNYSDKYMVEVTLRYDGSANFPGNKRYGLFPGVSAGWRISEEAFFNKDIIESLKIRASFGLLGNDRVDNFQYLQFYNLDKGNSSYVFGENRYLAKGLTPGTAPNPNITWETAAKTNFGIDFSLKNSLLTGSIEYFFEKRSDILTARNASVPVFTGLILPAENIGKVDNRGFELQLNHFNTIGDVRYMVGGQFSYAKSKIVFMDEAADTPEWQCRTGRPVDYLMVYKSDGFYQTQEEIDNSPHFPDAKPGDVKFVDVSGDGKLDGDDQIILTESPTPKIMYGITLGAEWKGFSINLLFQGQGMAKTIYRPWDLNQQVDYFEGRWTSPTETPNAKYPAAYDMSSSSILNISDVWVKDNSFLRLKNVELGYTFDRKVLDKLNISNLRVFASANNLFFVYDKVKYLDPETKSTTGWYYPQQRLISFGLNITF